MDSKSSKLSLPFFPEAIIEEILSRLPVTSLLRFRCVSKSWRCLIGCDRFIKIHLQTSSRNAAFAHHRLVLTKSLNSFDDRVNLLSESTVRIVGFCNGLVCCCTNLDQGRFLLWNPATRISKELPELVIENSHWSIVHYGFGWDESSGAHKVFVVLSTDKEWMGKLYSSNTNSWKTVAEYRDFELIYGEAEFVRGKLHWLRKRRGGSGGWYAADIATFDLKSEEFGVMELPRESTLWLSVNEGCLSAVCYNKRTHYDVWLMQQDSWVKATNVVVYEPCKILRSAAEGPHAEIWLVRGSTFELDDPAQVDVCLWIKKIDASFSTDLYVESLVSPGP